MRFDLAGANAGLSYLRDQRPSEWAEVLRILGDHICDVQLCQEEGRTTQMVFSPSMSNAGLEAVLREAQWMPGLALEAPTPETGRNIDYYKNGVVLELQFSHYGLLQRDIARMQKLYDGEIFLRGRPPVFCGIETVVTATMPRAQSVAHLEQAKAWSRGRAKGIPLVLVGLLPPLPGDVVRLHTLRPRARRSISVSLVTWQ